MPAESPASNRLGDDRAKSNSYTPKTVGDWASIPATVAEALDELAATAGGSGAPTNAEYVTWAANATLTNEKVLTGGEGIDITSSTATVDLDINGLTAEASLQGAADYVAVWDATASAHRKALLNDLPSGGAPTNSPYVTISNDASLSADRVLTAGVGMLLTDAGANSTVTLSQKSRVFIIDVSGAGTISNKTYQAGTVPSNKVLTAFESDDDSITVKVEIHAGSDTWAPTSVTLSGGGATSKVSNSDTTDTETPSQPDWVLVDTNDRVWTAEVTLTDADTSGTITATMSDGATATCTYTRSLDPPAVTSIVIGTPKYPGSQTQIRQGQTFPVTVSAEAHADEIYVKDFESTNGEGLQGPFTPGVEFNLAAGNANAINQKIRAYAKVTGGTNGADSDSSTPHVIDCDQTTPNLALSSITYPATQEALKDAENAQITVTDSNRDAGDTTSWDRNGESDFLDGASDAIANSEAEVDAGTYNTTDWNGGVKWVERQANNYRESGTNLRVTATRTTKNGATDTLDITVKIAHTAPTLTVTPTNRFGSGSGTKDRTITVTSSQANLSTHTFTMTPDAGDTAAFTGSWVASGVLAYTRTFRVLDADINAGGQAANNFSWAGVSAKNRAGKEVTVIGTNPNYSLGGFSTRTINMGPVTADPNHQADIGVPIVDTSQTTVVNTSKGGEPSQTYEGSVTEHNDSDSSLNNFWTTVQDLTTGKETFDDFTQYFHCSDKKFYDSVTAPGGFNCTVAEAE